MLRAVSAVAIVVIVRGSRVERAVTSDRDD
jgi:hypothetical protein